MTNGNKYLRSSSEDRNVLSSWYYFCQKIHLDFGLFGQGREYDRERGAKCCGY